MRSLERRLFALEQRHTPPMRLYTGRVIVCQGATPAETEARIIAACAQQGVEPVRTIARVIVRPQP